MGALFEQVLAAARPDVVHLHAVQWLSASLATACRERGIPYVITLHDCWWVCPRQFMVRDDGKYCFQEKIDLRVCQNCMSGARHLEHRWVLLQSALEGAALLLSPSEAHRRLYIANGVPPGRIEVAPNGVRLPAVRTARGKRARLRFAYVGGNVEVKGFSIVRRAFEALTRDDWDLVLVDNTLNLGFSSVDAAGWRVRGRIEVVPAYTQDGMDGFFAGVDVLLFPSQWKESFGLTVREALARDVWVIATEGGGPGEAIEDGVNGTLIPLDGRHEGLASAVDALLAAPGKLDFYRNPLADRIMTYDDQAAALLARLKRVVSEAQV
jgi:glycosyltransferase involved in cell wall biosynthesis